MDALGIRPYGNKAISYHKRLLRNRPRLSNKARAISPKYQHNSGIFLGTSQNKNNAVIVMSYFSYCSVIWHNCFESDKQRLERLNVSALRCVYNKRVNPHDDGDYGLTLCNRYLQDIAILVFKAVNGMLPEYICDLFVVRKNVKCLRGTNKLGVPRRNTTNFVLKSMTFIGSKACNSVPDGLRSLTRLKEFVTSVRNLNFL